MAAIDRRTTPRVTVDVDVRLQRHVGGPVAGRTVDLGAGGMRIATARPLRLDEIVHFDLRLAPEHALAGDARVMRLHPRNHYALRFEHLTAEDTDALTRFVALH